MIELDTTVPSEHLRDTGLLAIDSLIAGIRSALSKALMQADTAEEVLTRLGLHAEATNVRMVQRAIFISTSELEALQNPRSTFNYEDEEKRGDAAGTAAASSQAPRTR